MSASEYDRALAAVYCSITAACDLATGKPVGAMASHLLREIAMVGPPDLGALLMHVADTADESNTTTVVNS